MDTHRNKFELKNVRKVNKAVYTPLVSDKCAGHHIIEWNQAKHRRN
jgi:hypothetical protein